MSEKSKKEIIEALIETRQFSFEQIVIESGAKASYVKGVFSKLDLDWKEWDDPAVELKTILVPEEVTEEPVEEVTEEGADEEAKDDEQPQDPEETIAEEEAEEVTEESVEKVTEETTEADDSDLYKAACLLLNRANKIIVLKSIKNRSRKYREAVGKILESREFKARDMSALVSMYKIMRPSPSIRNSNKEIYELHKILKDLFNEANKK